MSYNYITDSHTNAVYKTTSPEGAKLIQQYMNQMGGMFNFESATIEDPPEFVMEERARKEEERETRTRYDDFVAPTEFSRPPPLPDAHPRRPFDWRPSRDEKRLQARGMISGPSTLLQRTPESQLDAGLTKSYAAPQPRVTDAEAAVVQAQDRLAVAKTEVLNAGFALIKAQDALELEGVGGVQELQAAAPRYSS